MNENGRKNLQSKISVPGVTEILNRSLSGNLSGGRTVNMRGAKIVN